MILYCLQYTKEVPAKYGNATITTPTFEAFNSLEATHRRGEDMEWEYIFKAEFDYDEIRWNNNLGVWDVEDCYYEAMEILELPEGRVKELDNNLQYMK